MSIEQRLEQVERQTKRLRIAVVVLATALCGVVSMAATESNNGYFDEVYAKRIWVQNDKDGIAVALGESEDGNGIVNTYSSTGKKLVQLHSSVEGEGAVSTYGPTGKKLVALVATPNGGAIEVTNKTGEGIIQLSADDYGNGEVGVWNRKGKGRVWDSQ